MDRPLKGLADKHTEQSLERWDPTGKSLTTWRTTRGFGTRQLAQQRADLNARRERCEQLLETFESATPKDLPLEARDFAKAAQQVEVARIDRALRDLEGEDERAAEHDRLRATRPEGCTCLGLGGTGVLTLAVSALSPDVGPLPCWSRPCSCPEGTAQVAAYDALVLAERAATLARDLEDDKARKAEERAMRRKRANLPDAHYGHLGWDGFLAEPGKSDAATTLKALAGAEKPPRVFLYGGFGTGKSALTYLLLGDWINAGRGGLWLPVSDYLEALRPQEGRPIRVTVGQADGAMRCSLLVLDDIGTERLTAWGRDALFRLLNGRLNDALPTVISSNYAPGELARRLADDADPREGQRLVERMLEPPVELLHVSGRNYRHA